MDYSPPGASVHGILQARILEWVGISRGSSWPRDQTYISSSSALAGMFFYHQCYLGSPRGAMQPLLLVKSLGYSMQSQAYKKSVSPDVKPGASLCSGESLSMFIFPSQVSNPDLPHCSWILYHLSHQGSPRTLEWVAYPFFSRSSPPRNWTGVSSIAGGFSTSWATREALCPLGDLMRGFDKCNW